MSLTQPLTRPITSPLTHALTAAGGGRSFPRTMLAATDEGFAIDFTSARMAVQDSSTPANAYSGSIAGKATVVGTLTSGADGAAMVASNFARLAEPAWPYDPSQITIAGEICFDAATDAALRAVFQIDAGGNDRLQVCALAGADDLTLSIGTGASAASVTAVNVIGAGVWLSFVAVAGPAGAFIVVDDTERASNAAILAASISASRHDGIGANVALTATDANASPMNGNMRSLIVLNRPVSKSVAEAGWPFGLSLAAIGDSITHGVVADVTQAEAYPALLQSRVGRIVNAINSGDQGDSTANMLNRRATIVADGTPDIVIIYGGTNDVVPAGTVQASPVPTATVFALEAGKGGYYAADGWITVAGESAQILSVAGDTITLTAALAAGAPAVGAAVAIDTQKNLTELALYAQAIGCTKVLIPGSHYWNWTTGGDTTTVELPRNATLRAKQAAAAAAAGVVYVDLYAHMRDLILAGTYTQGDNGWHSSTNNQHLNEAGQSILADAFLAAMQSEGWL